MRNKVNELQGKMTPVNKRKTSGKMNFDISNHTLSTLHLPDILIGGARYKRQGKGGEPEICEVGLK